jgi:hypothetical protein
VGAAGPASRRWAVRHGKPLVGNGDVHRLHQLDTTYSLVDAVPDADAICAAIVDGRVQVEHTSLSWGAVARTLAQMFAAIGKPKAAAAMRQRLT